MIKFLLAFLLVANIANAANVSTNAVTTLSPSSIQNGDKILSTRGGITGNTIASIPWPITLGGTGATIAVNARTNLGLGSLAVLNSINNSNWIGTPLTYANFQTVGANSLVGNATGSSATATNISLGATLGYLGTTLRTVAMTGDVTTSPNSFATTVTAIGGVSVGTPTGTGNIVFSNSPSLTTPVLGAASATSLSFSSATGLIGTATNDNAAAGSVGQIVESSVSSGSPVALTSGVAANLTSISLTAGDWEVEYSMRYFPANTTILTRVFSGISTVSATQAGVNDNGTNISSVSVTGDGANIFYTVYGKKRITIASTTTVYGVAQSTHSVSTCSVFGVLRARRVR
jgi:hypothetical protein